MKTGRTVRGTDTMRPFAILAIALAKGATAAQSSSGVAQIPTPVRERTHADSHHIDFSQTSTRDSTMSPSHSSSLLKARSALVAIASAALFAGCMTTDPQTGEEKVSHTSKDAGIGAVAGAILGAAVSSKHDRAKGALTGAAVGGGIGAAVGHRADKQEAELRKKLENSGVEVQRQGDTINLVVPSAISFATNSAQLTSNFYEPLNKVALSLKDYPDTTIQIVGHTDSTGAAAYNQQLSVNRANAVVVYLSAQGIAPERMQAVGMGPSQPIADNKTTEGRAQNRRVEIKIIPRTNP